MTVLFFLKSSCVNNFILRQVLIPSLLVESKRVQLDLKLNPKLRILSLRLSFTIFYKYISLRLPNVACYQPHDEDLLAEFKFSTTNEPNCNLLYT